MTSSEQQKQEKPLDSNPFRPLKSVDHAILTNCLERCWVSQPQLSAGSDASDPNSGASVATCKFIALGNSRGIVLGPDNICSDTTLSLRAHLSGKDEARRAFLLGEVVVTKVLSVKNDRKTTSNEKKQHE